MNPPGEVWSLLIVGMILWLCIAAMAIGAIRAKWFPPKCRECNKPKVVVFCGGGYDIDSWECPRCDAQLEWMPGVGYVVAGAKGIFPDSVEDQKKKTRRSRDDHQ